MGLGQVWGEATADRGEVSFIPVGVARGCEAGDAVQTGEGRGGGRCYTNRTGPPSQRRHARGCIYRFKRTQTCTVPPHTEALHTPAPMPTQPPLHSNSGTPPVCLSPSASAVLLSPPSPPAGNPALKLRPQYPPMVPPLLPTMPSTLQVTPHHRWEGLPAKVWASPQVQPQQARYLSPAWLGARKGRRWWRQPGWLLQCRRGGRPHHWQQHAPAWARNGEMTGRGSEREVAGVQGWTREVLDGGQSAGPGAAQGCTTAQTTQACHNHRVCS